MLASAVTENGIRIACAKFAGTNSAALKTMTDRVLEIAPDCIAVMFAIEEGKANISVACGKDTIGKGAHAGKIIKEVAGLVGGKGGGKPERAMAGVGDISKIDAALAQVKDVVAAAVKE